MALVKEFYANLFDPEEKSPRQVGVQGKLIKFDGETLNAFLETLVVLELESVTHLIPGSATRIRTRRSLHSSSAF